MPSRESEKNNWYANFSKQIATYGATLGLTPAEIAEIQAICKSNIDSIANNDAAQVAAKAARAAKNTQLSNGDKSLRVSIKKLKVSKGYTVSIGEVLKVIGDDGVAIDHATYKPKISLIVLPGRVRIEFVKIDLDGVNIYTRLKGNIVWTKLAYDSFSPYEDNRPLATPGKPEHREYMAIGVIKDQEVTLQSDIIEAVFGG